MQSPFSYYAMLARRWAWLVVLGIVICAGATYMISKRLPPVYQASATLVINLKSSTSPFDSVSASQLATDTYAQVLTSPTVLEPVLAGHPGLTLNQLSSMVSGKAQPNSSLIELDVDSSNPQMAAQLANEISQSFVSYANTYLLTPSTNSSQPIGNVVILPAEIPATPIKPKPIQYTGIGALVGLGLALSLTIIFEWIGDRLARPEEAQELLGVETLAIIPRLPRRQRTRTIEDVPALAEACLKVCAGLNAAQTLMPFKLVMITSALPGEGKSTIVANLASFLAMSGKRVLLVDADLRHPMLDQHFHLNESEEPPITLSEMWEQPEVKAEGQETDIPTLRVLTAGAPSRRPAELLQSPEANQIFDRLKKAPFDYIIFDSSPLLPVADAQLLASYVDAAVLVVDASKTPRGVLRRVRNVLSRLDAIPVGVVVNKSRWPDLSANRLYVHKMRQPRTKMNTTIPPSTSSEEGGVPEPEMTIVLPRLQAKREK
jgi:polysaccharide biosynthesis transport protein